MTYSRAKEEVWLDTFGTELVDYEERINMDRLRKERVEKARAQLKRYGLGAILTFRGDNIKYITGTRIHAFMAYLSLGMRYALLTKDGEKPIFYEHGDMDIQVRRHCPWLNVKYAIHVGFYLRNAIGDPATDRQLEKLAKQIKGDLKAEGVLDEPLGIDVYDPHLFEIFRRNGVEVKYAAQAMIDARECKTRDEIACIRIACAIADAAFAKIKEHIRPGVRERDLVPIIAEVCIKNGGEFLGDAVVCSGPNTWPNYRTYTDRMMRPGDIVYVDTYGITWGGYHTCQYRTFSIGEPKKETREAYQMIRDWLYDALKAVRPGNTTKDVAERFPSYEVWGRCDEDHAAGNAWAHGLGLSSYEPPIICRAWSLDYPMPLKEGQVFAIETQVGDGKGQGVRLENVVLVTETGYEVLNRYPDEDIIVCPI